MDEHCAAQIWEGIRRANGAWLDGEPRAAAGLFHDRAVVAGPDGRPLAEGRDAVVQTYVDYCERAVTHAFDVIAHDVRVFGDTAVVTYEFRVRYSLEGGAGAEFEEVGRELVVLARSGDAWSAVWRMQLAAG